MALTPEEISDLKEVFGPIFRVTVGSNSYICRTITRSEAKAAGIDNGVTSVAEDAVFALSVLDPEILDVVDVQNFPANDVTEVANKVLKRSCLLEADDVNEVLDRARIKSTLDVFAMASAVIVAAFPFRTFESIDDMNIEEWADEVARAELVNEVRAMVSRGTYAGVRFGSITPNQEEVVIPDGPIDLNDENIPKEIKDEIVKRKLAEAAAQAGLINGSFHERQFGMTANEDTEHRVHQWGGGQNETFREREKF